MAHSRLRRKPRPRVVTRRLEFADLITPSNFRAICTEHPYNSFSQGLPWSAQGVVVVVVVVVVLVEGVIVVVVTIMVVAAVASVVATVVDPESAVATIVVVGVKVVVIVVGFVVV